MGRYGKYNLKQGDPNSGGQKPHAFYIQILVCEIHMGLYKQIKVCVKPKKLKRRQREVKVGTEEKWRVNRKTHRTQNEEEIGDSTWGNLG